MYFCSEITGSDFFFSRTDRVEFLTIRLYMYE